MAASLKIFRGNSDESRPLRLGGRLDKYRLLKRMGEGGFATVYAARDMIVDRHVALKIPQLSDEEQGGSFEDLKREVRIMAKLDHPGILPLQDARFIDGHFVMVFTVMCHSIGKHGSPACDNCLDDIFFRYIEY